MDRSRLPRRLAAAAVLVVAVIGGLVVTSRAYRMESEAVDDAAARLTALAVRETPRRLRWCEHPLLRNHEYCRQGIRCRLAG